MAPTLYDYYGRFFLKQGRERFLRGCVILCIAKFEHQDSKEKFNISFLDRGQGGIHAEEIVLNRIEEEESRKDW
jgi:hypothetical protein